MWDCTSSLAILQMKINLRPNDGDFSQGNVFFYSGGNGNGSPYTLAESQYLMTRGKSSPVVHANLECLKVSNKISFFEPDSRNYTHSLFSRFINRGSNIPIESCKPRTTTAGIPYDLISIYGWMSEISVSGLKQQLNSTSIENKKSRECCLCGDINSTSYCSLGNTANPANNLTIGSADYTEITIYVDSSPSQRTTAVANADMTSLSSDPFLKDLQTTEANGIDVKTPHSRFHGDYYVNNLAAYSHIYEECKYKNEDDQLYLDKANRENEFAMADKTKTEVCSTTDNKPHHFGLAKQEHAFAGALAGIFVSLCLHPMDTVKTVIQSCHADQRSINYIGRSIISERGVTGLYRGIASNITSSAPISAIYTFTYESVKGVLLPFLPKEHQSVAHCMAGGCASIATSFVFTPSERIKQQMQVGSHFQNCWTALVGIIRKGGLPSLYTGWGAVLCRNVPHSIIKFYTYESLKQLMLSSPKTNAQPNTLQTLLCGGLAGSTAALFTTPFDVVKTRLQTQIPGSIRQYDGVFNTLIKIGKHEGLKGLYRGLTPRLVMYISQGAIFFASYESFKRLLSQEMPQIYAHTIGYLQNMEDEAP